MNLKKCINFERTYCLHFFLRSQDKRDIDVIRENHRFLWDEEEIPESWEAKLAKKYYDKLFKEYCICDLSRYKENKVMSSSSSKS
jgi:protein FRA10AC1